MKTEKDKVVDRLRTWEATVFKGQTEDKGSEMLSKRKIVNCNPEVIY